MKKLLLLAILAISPALAQQPSSSGPNVALSFTVMGWGQVVNGLSYRDGSKFVDLGTIPLFERGRTFKYSGPNKIPLFNSTAPAPGKTAPEPVAVAEIPAGIKRAILLVAPQGQRFQCLVIPDDLDTVPAGKALIVNLSPKPLGIRANKKDNFKLESKGSKLLAPGDKDLVQLDVHHQDGEEWTKVRNFFLPLPATSQTIIFFLESNSDYFKDADNRVTKPVQTVVLRRDLNASEEQTAPSASSDSQPAASEGQAE